MKPKHWILQGLLLSTLVCATGVRAAEEAPMRFEVEEDTPQNRMVRLTLHGGRHEIYATGIIDEAASERLLALVRSADIKSARVNFDSEGGSLLGGLKLGELIRELGFETEVKAASYEYGKGPVAMCASACSYAFAGGAVDFSMTKLEGWDFINFTVRNPLS